jgi:monofunctional biosynthetic peptidoglycan transglycosylase
LVIVVGASIALYLYFALPSVCILALRTENPRLTALMLERLDESGGRLHILQTWVPLSRISQHLINGVVISEDGTFFEHGGVDWYEVRESLERNLEEERVVRGSSTITMQLAKNLFLSTSRDPLRKLKELVIALRIEKQLSKRRILEIYLNLIEWGDGIFGAEAASKAYFGKPAQYLTREEAARMAAVIPSPIRHRPDSNNRYVVRRSEIILNRMSARGW